MKRAWQVKAKPHVSADRHFTSVMSFIPMYNLNSVCHYAFVFTRFKVSSIFFHWPLHGMLMHITIKVQSCRRDLVDRPADLLRLARFMCTDAAQISVHGTVSKFMHIKGLAQDRTDCLPHNTIALILVRKFMLVSVYIYVVSTRYLV
jgi:hypothetical protein